MTKLSLLQELAEIVDSDVIVMFDYDNVANIETKFISIRKDKTHDAVGHAVCTYMTIDMGFDFTPYCSDYVFWFLHELGHIVNGYVDENEYSLYATTIGMSDMNVIEKMYHYMRLQDEVCANIWAMDFIKKNKKVVKRLDKELNAVQG